MPDIFSLLIPERFLFRRQSVQPEPAGSLVRGPYGFDRMCRSANRGRGRTTHQIRLRRRLPVVGLLYDTLTIPTPKPPASDTQTKDFPEVSKAKSGGKVLVVDDQSMILRALKRLLTRLGYDEVLIAENGKAGFELYKEHAKDLRIVFLDLVMPEWDGAATFAAFHEFDPEIPVVVMSGYVEEQVEDSFQGGPMPTGFLQKPFDEDLVKACLELARQP